MKQNAKKTGNDFGKNRTTKPSVGLFRVQDSGPTQASDDLFG